VRLLYLSCHETLEYDELRMFTELGFDCFSVGYWMNPAEPKTKMRPPIPGMKVNHELIAKFERDYPDYKLPKAEFYTGTVKLQKDFLDNFDIVVNGYYVYNLQAVLENSNLPVVHRTIDIMNEKIEGHVTQLHFKRRPFFLVRMSEAELELNKVIGCQAVIKQSVEQEKFNGWTGEVPRIFTNIKGAKSRPDISFDLYDFTTQSHDRLLVGGNNEGVEWAVAGTTQEEFLKMMQQSRVNYVQPRMCGCPTVTYGTKFNGKYWQAGKYIKNGINGYCVNTTEEAMNYIDRLMEDEDLAKALSIEARETAIKHFSYSAAKAQWEKFFKETRIKS
jgi:glycosyltransferase involved in cell wall biosynthesis